MTGGCAVDDERRAQRAQLVVTVVNADTGAVASASVTPGVLQPRPAHGRWLIALTPVIAELAAAVSATALVELTGGGRPLGDEDLPLPPEWHPDLPADRRDALVAAVLVNYGGGPWRVFQGRDSAPPPPDPTARLAQLCRLADQLHVDLVAEVRRTAWGGSHWDVRYALPGASVPARSRVRGDDLPEAVVATTVTDAFDGIEPRELDAPGYFLRPGARPPSASDPPDLDQVERRVLRDAEDRPGAQAIWRNGRWWHTSLRIHPPATTLVRGWEPPAPDWRGAPIPYDDCPGCEPPCYICGDSRRVYRGSVVSVTDLAGRVVHENWSLEPEPVTAPRVATQPSGKTVVQLPERHRLARLAAQLGQAPADLTELDLGCQLSQDLRNGIVTLNDPADDPLATQLARATRGRPGGRLLLAARPAAAPPLTELIRITLGLGLAIAITVRDHRLDATDPLRVHGERWAVEVLPDDAAAPFTDWPLQPSLAAAVAHCVTYLELALVAAVPADPHQPIPVPQAPPSAPVADPTPLVARLGRHHPGKPVTVRLDRAGCTVHLREDGATRLLAAAATLPAAFTALGLPAGDIRVPAAPRG